jgi:NADH-quinone oxidoreductase E subunit
MKGEEKKAAKRYSEVSERGPLREILKRYEGEQGALIPILQDLQDAYGYLDEEILSDLAEGTGYQLSRIYGVATFYTQFRLNPIGEHLIRVCHGTACHVAGAELITSEISNYLGIKDGETTEDQKFTLESVMCVGACSLSPIMMVDEDTHGKLKPTNIRRILKGYAKDGTGDKE